MTSFSDRHGLGRTVLQIDSMDDNLRVDLWNTVYLSYVAEYFAHILDEESFNWLAYAIWASVMKRSLGKITPYEVMFTWIEYWIQNSAWNRVYDLIEFIPNNCPPRHESRGINARFRSAINSVLERNLAGYRFVGNELVRITADEELQSIEKSLTLAEPFATASEHLRQAVQLLSDREDPDYRNSIKESISAVEAACQVVSGKPKATLGDALRAVGDESAHPALRAAFEKLYGWTSNAAGIRHAMTDDTSASFEEAQFMVVACSAFTNYLAAKFANGNG